MAKQSDAVIFLLEQARRDPRAQDELIEALRESIQGHARRCISRYCSPGGYVELEDVTQSIIVAFLEEFRQADIRNFRPWLAAFCQHRTIDYIRKAGRFPRRADDLSLPAGSEPRHAPNPDKDLLFHQLVARLSREERSIAYCFYKLDWSHKQIGKTFGMKTNLVGGKIRRITKKMKKFLET